MTGPASSLDAELGDLVRLYRLTAGLSQVELGEAAGISYQQIQKYESGANKVSVARLFTVAAALGMAPSELLGELERRLGGETATESTTSVETLHFMSTRRGQQVIRAMAACEDPKLLDAFVDLFLSVSASGRKTNGVNEERIGLAQ